MVDNNDQDYHVARIDHGCAQCNEQSLGVFLSRIKCYMKKDEVCSI